MVPMIMLVVATARVRQLVGPKTAGKGRYCHQSHDIAGGDHGQDDGHGRSQNIGRRVRIVFGLTVGGFQPDNGRKRPRMPVGKCELPATIAATTEVGVGLERKISARGSSQGGRLGRRTLIGTKKMA